jgi:hypothetical protein
MTSEFLATISCRRRGIVIFCSKAASIGYPHSVFSI